MLVLERREDQNVTISELIGGELRELMSVRVLEIQRGYVKLGFEGPREINVCRAEAVRQLPHANGRQPKPDRRFAKRAG